MRWMFFLGGEERVKKRLTSDAVGLLKSNIGPSNPTPSTDIEELGLGLGLRAWWWEVGSVDSCGRWGCRWRIPSGVVGNESITIAGEAIGDEEAELRSSWAWSNELGGGAWSIKAQREHPIQRMSVSWEQMKEKGWRLKRWGLNLFEVIMHWIMTKRF